MKRKVCMAILAAGMLAAAGCGSSSTAQSSAETEQTAVTGTENVSETRLVSVDSVDKYIELGEYRGIVLNETVEEVTEEDVDSRIQEDLKANMEAVNRSGETVQDGDGVTISFVGKKDGEAFEGGSSDSYDLIIGEGTMIPGFEEGIIGMKRGETKEVPLTFPEDYRASELAGQDVVFQITLQSFRRAPELTEEWVTENTEYASLDEYRAGMRALLEQTAQAEAESSRRSTAWTTVYTTSEVMEYPQEDIDEAAADFRRQAQSYADQAGMELETFVESQGISMEDFEAQCQQYAQAKVKQNLIIQGIMDEEDISLDDAECLAIQDQLVQEYSAGDLAGLIDTYGQAAVDETIGLIRVQDFIIEHAYIEQGSPDTASGEEAQNADAAAAAGEEAQNADAAAAAGETAQSTDADAAAGETAQNADAAAAAGETAQNTDAAAAAAEETAQSTEAAAAAGEEAQNADAAAAAGEEMQGGNGQ